MADLQSTAAPEASSQPAKPAAAPMGNPYIVAMAVSLAAFMEVLDTTITNVSLSHIAGSLAASQDESTWVLTSYLVANGIVLPLSGWLSGVMGRKIFFLTCIAGFTVASFACGMATSLPMLIVFRLLQGLAGGGLQPTQQAIISDSFPPEKRGTAFAITGITMIAAPILGPTLGGFITDNYTWRWIFFMNVPVGLVAFMLVSRLVTDPEPGSKPQRRKSIDYIGLSFVVLALGCMQIVLDKGQEADWFASTYIVVLTAISVTCLIAGIVWILRQKEAIVDLRLLKIPSFGYACVTIFFVGFVLYGCSTLLPLLLQSQFGYDATLAGLVLSPSGIVVIFMMPIAGKLSGKIQARYLIAAGMFLTATGMWITMHVTPDATYGMFVFMRIMQVIGLPLLFVPTSTMAFSDIPREKSSNASALYSLMRNLGGSIGISILSSYQVRHEQIHQAYLSQHLEPSNDAYRATLAQYTQAIINQGQAASSATQAAMGKLYLELVHQSTILSYRDCFQLVAIILLILAFVALRMPRNDLHKKSSTDAAAH